MSIKSSDRLGAPRGGESVLVLCAALALCGSASAGQEGHVWTHQSENGNWIGKVVSIGDAGTQVFTALGISNSHARLFASSDTNPPTPIWDLPEPDYAWKHAVASAAHSSVHAYLHYESTTVEGPNHPVVRKHSAMQGPPDWSWSFPFTVTSPEGGVDLSEDGSVLVAWVFSSAANQLMVAGFDGDTGVPTSYTGVYVHGAPKAVRLSPDASVLYVSSVIKTVLMDPLTGATLYQKYNWDGVTAGHAISRDGDLYAEVLPPNRVRVHRRTDGEYEEVFAYELPGPNMCNNVALSADGSLLVCAFDFYDTWLEIGIQAFDLTRPNQPMVVDDRSIGAGIYSNVTSSISVADDGSAFVLGSWGDELGQAPELRAYRRSGGSWRLSATHDLPGSVYAVAMSPDGLRFASASKLIHANQMGGGGRIDTYEVDSPDVTVRGVPVAGARVTLRQRTPPHAQGRMLYSRALSDPPLPMPRSGILYLDRSDLHFLPVGTADGRGVLDTPFDLPTDPSMIGRSIYFQGMQLQSRRLTQSWAKITILP